MVDDVGALRQALHRVHVAAVRLVEADALGKILQIAADHVVTAGDLVSSLNEFIGQMASEEARRAGNKNFHPLRSQVV